MSTIKAEKASKFVPDNAKLEYVRSVHKNILHRRKIDENYENRRVLEQNILEGSRKGLFNIPMTGALPIEVPAFAKIVSFSPSFHLFRG